jgi:uncharacterized cofD-like protein
MARKLVVIGGGTGSFAVLAGLRDSPVELCSIVTMMDSGGDSGVLRDAYGVLPPGDLRRCLVALSEESAILRDLFSVRFQDPPLAGRNFGNLFLLALSQSLGCEKRAVDAIGKILKIRGRVLPVTWDHAHLIAHLDDGSIVEGEAAIDARCQSLRLHSAPDEKDPVQPAIGSVHLEPPAVANPEAITSIETCDFVILAPGDLYTSTIPNLLVDGIPQAIASSRAPLVYVMNLMTKPGETDGFTASQHVERIERYLGRVPDALLVHRGRPPADLLHRYELEGAEPVAVDDERLAALGVGEIFRRDIMSAASLVRHDPARTAAALLGIIQRLEATGMAKAGTR